MLTFIWLAATTLIGYYINDIWFIETPHWIGAVLGFAIGVVLKVMLSVGPGDGISGAFDDFSGSDSD